MKTGLFIVSYNITTGLAGAPNFEVHLTVSTPTKEVNGMGHITQATNPPLEIISKISGDFTYMTVMPNSTHILVTAQGYPNIQWPPNAGIGPVILPNSKLRMILEDNWQSGTASFSYVDSQGNWIDITNAKVEAINQNSFAENLN
jgi:hypothetical protein